MKTSSSHDPLAHDLQEQEKEEEETMPQVNKMAPKKMIRHIEGGPSCVEVLIYIFIELEHIIICLQILTITGGEVTATVTAKHKVRVIHVCDDPFNSFNTWYDWEYACDPRYLRLINVDVCMHILYFISKLLLHEFVVDRASGNLFFFSIKH